MAVTSPAMLAAASTPVNAITAIGSANARSDQLGAVPRWMLALSACGSNTSTNPSTMISACRIRSATGDPAAAYGSGGR